MSSVFVHAVGAEKVHRYGHTVKRTYWEGREREDHVETISESPCAVHARSVCFIRPAGNKNKLYDSIIN